MKAEDVMTRDVISIAPDATVLQAARLMLQRHISGLPVVDKDGKLVGVLSEGDFLRRRETRTEHKRSRWLEFLMGPGRMAAEYSHSHGSKVAEVMTTEVQTVDELTALEDIVDLMERKRIKRVPVVCGGQLVGIVTRSNLMHAMVSMARKVTSGIPEGDLGACGHDQCSRARRCRRIVGCRHRRAPTRSNESGCRKHFRREGSE
jgi:CBS domain-containing protein